MNNNIIEIEVFTRNIQLECSRDVCIWYSVDSLDIYTVVGNSITYTIPYITIENNKQYVLSTQDKSGQFVPAASIRIIPIGMLFNFFKININNGTTYIGQIFNEIFRHWTYHFLTQKSTFANPGFSINNLADIDADPGSCFRCYPIELIQIYLCAPLYKFTSFIRFGAYAIFIIFAAFVQGHLFRN